MRCFRVAKARRAAEAFDGEGARAYGGRWNPPGLPMVYAADSLALAALETFVHFSGEERAIPFVAFTIEIPEACVERLPERDLPADWRSGAPSSATQDLGRAWARSGRSLALAVPSAIVPSERCILLNPLHPDTRKAHVAYPEPFSFDPRLWK